MGMEKIKAVLQEYFKYWTVLNVEFTALNLILLIYLLERVWNLVANIITFDFSLLLCDLK